jgi:hypothetical protein
MLNLNKNKHYYLFNFINVFIKNKYLFFMKDRKFKLLISEYKTINYIKIKSSFIKKLFVKNNFFNIFKNNILLLYFNELAFSEKLLKYNNDILAISSSMYLINNNYKKNIYNYYLYYKDNYLLYKKIIFLFFEKYYFLIFFILRNLIILLNIKKKNIR